MGATRHAGVTVVRELPVYEEIEGHHTPAAIYVSPEHLSGFPLKIAAVDAAELVGRPLADLHTHTVDELYLVVSPGLKFEVQTDETAIDVTSPASVRIPAGTRHRFVVHEAATKPCVFLGILVDTDGHGAPNVG